LDNQTCTISGWKHFAAIQEAIGSPLILKSRHRNAVKFRKVTGTHVAFTHPSVPNCVAIPMKKKVRAVHVKAFIDLIDRMDELDR
jgi:hypothetical protein